jgi:hypothetical protein
MQSEAMIPGYYLGCVEFQVGLDSPKTPFSVQFSARSWPIALALADGSCEVLHGGAPKSFKDKTMESNVAMENPPSIDSLSLMISPAVNLHG